MSKTLTTDQMTTLLKTLTIFIENRDPFVTENIINELKRDGDQFNGFYDDKGNCIADDLYVEIDDAIDSLVLQYFPDFIAEQRRVYIFEPKKEQNDYDYHDLDDEDEFDEVEDLNEEDYETDKEGNRIPSVKNYTDPTWPDTDESGKPIEQDEDVNRGAGWYKDQDGEWQWDRDAAESARYAEDMYEEDVPNYSVNDHNKEYELSVDKNKRINIGKKIFVKAIGYDENEKVTVIADNDGTQFYIISTNDLNWTLGDNQWVVGNYELKNGALRLGISSFIDNVQAGDIMYAKIHWPVMCTDDNILYVHVYSK